MSYQNTQLLIDGQWQDAADGRTMPVYNPATDEEIGRVAHASIADLDRALAAAEKGFAAWRDTPAVERQKIMRRAAALVRERAERMLGAPYPVDQLALFGVVMAVRGKWPKHPLLRKLVRIALDRALPSESPALVCSEVVYRAWAECDVAPRGRMADACHGRLGTPGPGGPGDLYRRGRRAAGRRVPRRRRLRR